MEGLSTSIFIGGSGNGGGSSKDADLNAHIIVGCLGKIKCMIRQRQLQMHAVKLLILDEADNMLMGGGDDVFDILRMIRGAAAKCKCTRHCTFQCNHANRFSTNIVPQVFGRQQQQSIVHIHIEPEKLSLEGIKQYYVALKNDKGKIRYIK